ncbi:MAG TPA: glycoside hydrolase family 9 protein [Candidatus Sulfomarinibacteraceae bacterium]|nr:glycoside hydrolase family 9 protein [Candidatus Sulfomarinibacteraceae bacterium]
MRSRIAPAGWSVVPLAAAAVQAAPVTTDIKLDPFGYRPGDPKVAVFSADPGATVEVRTTGDIVVLTVPTDGGSIVSKGFDGDPSGDTIWWVDLSDLDEPGTYRLYSAALGAQSVDFAVRDDVYEAVLRTALKTLYLQRCNTPKTPAHAGAWADDAPCHMGDLAVGPAAGHTNHGVLDLSGGWHDAGDYNKYVWTATSTAVLHLLRAFEANPGLFVDGDLDIPESGNGVPDILDEVRWELDYPYFKGVDNRGVSDDKSSTLGPAPGFVPGGPNASCSGTAVPPAGAGYLNRFYRDWCDQTVWTAVPGRSPRAPSATRAPTSPWLRPSYRPPAASSPTASRAGAPGRGAPSSPEGTWRRSVTGSPPGASVSSPTMERPRQVSGAAT